MKSGTLIATVALCAPCLAQNAAPPANGGAPAPKSGLHEALAGGKVSLDIRLRHEHVDQDNALDSANALTVRTRLGYRTAPWLGLTAMVEGQNTLALTDDYQEPGHPANGHSVVADPDVTEVSQAWLAYVRGKTELRAGRQNLVLDNARFVGNVAWRQSWQTFDAVTLRDTTFKDLTATYGYLWGVKRVFGDPDNTAFADFESDSHLFHLAYAGLPVGTVTSYVHLLDFENAPANSSATAGISYTGTVKIDDAWSLPFRAEYAAQADHGSNTDSYHAGYLCAELGVKHARGTVTIAYEVLGSDDGRPFRTPLATLHAFNGWADMFLNTPAGGLADLNVKVATKVGPVELAAAWHQFTDDSRSVDYGDEFDAQATWRPHKAVTLLAKLAHYRADGFGVDTTKLATQAEYKF